MFCTKVCWGVSKTKNQTVTNPCGTCGTPVKRSLSQAKKSKSGHVFCNSRCSVNWSNSHKTKGTRRSKLEVWLEPILRAERPDLKILFNDKTSINSELDIYLPELKLAFELNGIFHYEPIYGDEKLASIQNNDSRKFQACLEQGIELCIIDTSSLVYFKEKSARKFLHIILMVISRVESAGIEPTRDFSHLTLAKSLPPWVNLPISNRADGGNRTL